MTFTSNLFLIGLLPFFVCLYNRVGNKKPAARQVLLLLANSLFIVWGGVGYLLFHCAFSIIISLLATIVYKIRNRLILTFSVLLSVVPLVVTKYTAFIINIINSVTGFNATAPSIVIPIGISFVTFEAISLLVDIFRGTVSRNPSLFNTYLYLSFFPTVTSGPIIRYDDFNNGLYNHHFSCDYMASIERIEIGLCKKVLIADKIAILADYYFDGVALGNNFSCVGLWIGSIAYSLQLYFDFSGYSDMAIGIGGLLGFNISENFNQPYQACSISDFWKRWHISLTQWFRDYIYIPLGGNRCAKGRHIINMLLVWLLTGIWHGADWKYIFWGIGYFLLIVSEKYLVQKHIRVSKIISHIYTLFFVNLLWVPFRADNLSVTVNYISGLFGKGIGNIEAKAVRFIPLIVLAIILCFPWNKLFRIFRDSRWFYILKGVTLIILVCLAICATVNSSYAPYIYGNF